MMHQIILEQIKLLYARDGDIGSLELLGGFNNNVFLSRKQKMVLKILDVDVYKKINLLNEKEIINIMLLNGIKTPNLIPSKNGVFIEIIKGGEKAYYLMAYSYIEGAALSPTLEDGHFIKAWGKLLGKMLEITKLNRYEFKQSYLEWNHDVQNADFAKGYGEVIEEKWQTYMEKLSMLSKGDNEYGIVHHDLHNQNILVKNKDLHVLDFGDVRKSWYIYDAVIPIFHFMESNRHLGKTDQLQMYKKFTYFFLEGYSEETALSEIQLNLIPYFLDYRLLYSFLFLMNSFKDRKMSAKVEKHLEEMRLRIEKDVPFIPVT